jgi:glycosyltransferase involved in cell wall biosynthesis
MRIGLITGEYPPMQGGVGAFTRELALAFAQQGHQPYVLTDRRVPSSDADGIHVTGQVSGWNRASLFQVRQWAASQRLDVINIQHETAAFQMAQLVHFLPILLRGFPVVTTFHDLLVPYLFPKAGPLRFRALLALARASQGVIVTNAQDEQRLRVRLKSTTLATIPIGSNVSAELPSGYHRGAWRASLGIPDDPDEAILVGYFGFINASKGVDTLLDGVAQAIAQGLDVHVLMIGGRTGASDPTNVADSNEIDRRIDHLGLQSRLQWTGFVEGPQVSANLTACDMVALPYKDGVSLRRGSFMAAIAHGCAIITTQPPTPLPEIQDRLHALLIPPESPSALAAAIRELATDEPLRFRLQANAQTLSACFTWDRIAAQTISFYEKILGATHR